jgi:hypothetical protein
VGRLAGPGSPRGLKWACGMQPASGGGGGGGGGGGSSRRLRGRSEGPGGPTGRPGPVHGEVVTVFKTRGASSVGWRQGLGQGGKYIKFESAREGEWFEAGGGAAKVVCGDGAGPAGAVEGWRHQRGSMQAGKPG